MHLRRHAVRATTRLDYDRPVPHSETPLLRTALDAAESAADRGLDAVLAAAQSAIMGESHVTLTRLALVNPETNSPLDDGYRGVVRAVIQLAVGGERVDGSRDFYVN